MRLEGRTAESVTFGVIAVQPTDCQGNPVVDLGQKVVLRGLTGREFTRVILAAGAKNLLSVMFVGEWAQICFQQWQELQTCI